MTVDILNLTQGFKVWRKNPTIHLKSGWRMISSSNTTKPKRLFRCPACGEVITEEAWEEALQSGSGYCYCEFSDVDPDTGEIWYPRILHEYDVYHLSETTKSVASDKRKTN